ncbi:MAG: phosphatidate cytidylyltransferase [Lachnospiraceae bacterium]|nr:phosphatidate cytidylyltransferase [Lachnospiraceae bacterium]
MQELLHGAGMVILYIIPAAGLMLTARKLLKIPDELFRKILHFILLGIYIPALFAFKTWWISALFVVALIVIIYPLLALAGRIPAFSAFINERKRGELKHSMVLALGVMAVSICVCWGGFGDRYLVLAGVYTWGVGDAFAALVGKKFGRHKISWKFADNRKSVEGSLAMFFTSALAACLILYLRGGVSIPGCLLISLLASAVCTLVELCTRNGFDTISCPTAALLVILPLIHILGG